MAKAVVKAKEAPKTVTKAVAQAQMPAHMMRDVGKGTENIGNDDLEIPRLKLIQGLSPELETFNGLRPGQFFHTAAEHIFEGAFKIVPLYVDKRYILWRPLEDGGGILARADDGVHWSPADREFDVKLDKKDGGARVKWKTAKTVADSGLANWGTLNPADPDSAPAATLMYSFVVAFPDHPELMPAVLTFQRSSIKFGRRFLTKLKTVRAPIFGCQFELSSFKDSNASNQEFSNINVSGAGFVEDEELYNEYKSAHETFSAKGIQIKDIESAQGEGGDASGDEPEETVKDSKGRARSKF